MVKIVQDARAGSVNAVADSDPDELAAFHAERAPESVTWAGRQAIDEAERAAGERRTGRASGSSA